MNFAIGDVVTLKSGSPRMTVIKVDGDTVTCSFFRNGAITSSDFPTQALEPLDRLGGQGPETSPVTGLGEPSGAPPRADQRESHRGGQCEQENVGENRIHLTSVGSPAGEIKRTSTRA